MRALRRLAAWIASPADPYPYSPLTEAVQILRDEQTERSGAAQCDANLTELRAADPDAAAIFDGGGEFEAARHDRVLQDLLTRRIQDYADAKHARGEMHLYHRLFAGSE